MNTGMNRLCMILAGCGLLAGCLSNDFSDLDEWMQQESQGIRARIDPVPALQPYVAFNYDADSLNDPFSPAKAQTVKGKGAGAPDPNWRKEALEDFDLEKLQMVGTLQNKKEGLIALVKTPSKEIFRLKVGNHIGRNFGVITQITDNELIIKELVEDSNGDWSERPASLKLTEQEQK